MVSAGVCYGGKSRLHFIEEKAKVNAAYYVSELLPKLVEDCNCCCHLVSYSSKTVLQLTLPVWHKTGWRPTALISSHWMNGHQIPQRTRWIFMSGVQCSKHTTNFSQNPRPFWNWRAHCSRSGLIYRSHQLTKLLMTFANDWTPAFQQVANILNMHFKQISTGLIWTPCWTISAIFNN